MKKLFAACGLICLLSNAAAAQDGPPHAEKPDPKPPKPAKPVKVFMNKDSMNVSPAAQTGATLKKAAVAQKHGEVKQSDSLWLVIAGKPNRFISDGEKLTLTERMRFTTTPTKP